MSTCVYCNGLIAEGNKVYGYAGKFCNCARPVHMPNSKDYDRLMDGVDKILEKNAEKKGVDSTLEERGARYGLFVGHASIAQTLKSVMTANKGWDRLHSDQKEALEMIQHKIARILNGDPNYADSWHDIAGYATLVEKRLNGESL